MLWWAKSGAGSRAGDLISRQRSRLQRHDDTKHIVGFKTCAVGGRCANMRASIGSGDLDNLVARHPDPAAVLHYLVVVADAADFSGATIGKVAAGRLCVGALQLRIEVGMPLVMTLAVVAVLCRGGCGKTQHRSKDKHPEGRFHHELHATTTL